MESLCARCKVRPNSAQVEHEAWRKGFHCKNSMVTSQQSHYFSWCEPHEFHFDNKIVSHAFEFPYVTWHKVMEQQHIQWYVFKKFKALHLESSSGIFLGNGCCLWDVFLWSTRYMFEGVHGDKEWCHHQRLSLTFLHLSHCELMFTIDLESSVEQIRQYQLLTSHTKS